jgi:hypothetical protein
MKRILWVSLISLICTVSRGQGVGGNGVPGAAGSGSASIPATSSVLKGAGSAGSATAATPGTDYMAGVTATAAGQVPVATGPGGAYSAQTLTYNNVGASPGVTPLSFGGYGDAKQIANGCTTTTTSTTIVCPVAPFVPGDVGKQLWVTGAGAAGVAFGSTISTVVSNTTVTVSATPSISVTQNRAVFGHDDVSAIQACWNYSRDNAIQCKMNSVAGFNTPSGYLVSSGGLTIPTLSNITGNSPSQGTTLFCEFNGDCLSLPTGGTLQTGQPVQGVNLANLDLEVDPSQPSGRGIHLNAATGQYNFGGMFNSTLSNIQVQSSALECLWIDGGAAGTNLPNQYITFHQFNCNGPNQQHNSAEIRVSGQNAQIIFLNGAINGVPTHSFYPNPLIRFDANSGNAPGDIKFYGYTCEVGTQCLYAGPGSTNIHYDNGYMEQIDSPLIADTSESLTFNGNHLANSGNVTAAAQFLGNVTASMRDTLVYGSTTPAAFAVCTGSTNTVDFAANNSTVTTTTGCATSTASLSGSTLTITGGTSATVAAYGTPITTITAPGINSGKTLALDASGTFSLASGGNINLGGLPSPLTIAAGQSVTLTLFDLGPTWLVTSTTAGAVSPPSLNTTFFDDFYTGANMASVAIGSAVGSSCSPSNTFTDNNHPGNMLLTAGTGGTGTGILCGLVSQANSITSANTSQGWTWETAVFVPVLPGTTAGAYQAGMVHTPNANPWTTGIGFYLSSANGVVNDWYCRYNSTSTDSGVAATVAWTRLTMVNDGTNVHWYIGGTQVCGTGVAIGSMPSTTQYPAVWSATALSGTSVAMAYDYINWQRAVSR